MDLGTSSARVEIVADPRLRRHLYAVRQSLAWADEAALRGDYADAVEWLEMVRALGHKLPPEYEERRQLWTDALGGQGASAGSGATG